MRTILIVSPRFLPNTAADMQRVRVSLPYYRKFGWDPIVLSVKPECVEGVREVTLLKTVPPDIPVHRVAALPVHWTRRCGWSDVALRAFPFLYSLGLQLIRQRRVDLVCFSTTAFFVLPLGRMWKARTHVPFVIDIQDPWVNPYPAPRATIATAPKHWLARRLHGILERWTMAKVDGLLAVSEAYLHQLGHRHRRLATVPQKTIPFGGSSLDFETVREVPQPNRYFHAGDGYTHGVYVGRGGHDMATALRIIFAAFQEGLRKRPELFSRIRLHFIGTDYAPADRARKTIEPIAREFGKISQYVQEEPRRIPYLEALQLLLDADFLVVPGSDDPTYTASKIFPYIMAQKPLLGVFHECSSVVRIVNDAMAGSIVTFRSGEPAEKHYLAVFRAWTRILESGENLSTPDWDAFREHTASAMTQKQCELFDHVLSEGNGVESHG